MTKAISIALVVGGVVLLYFGGQAFNSVSSDVARVFTGSPSNKAIMLIVGGVIATLAGITGLALSGRKR
jgi:ammonia channel protein AmtB